MNGLAGVATLVNQKWENRVIIIILWGFLLGTNLLLGTN